MGPTHSHMKAQQTQLLLQPGSVISKIMLVLVRDVTVIC